MSHHYNQSFIDFHQRFFQGCIFIATFGASITFQVIIQQLDNQSLLKEPNKISTIIKRRASLPGHGF
jgi:hypothetical protein